MVFINGHNYWTFNLKDFTRKWAKPEKDDVSTLSECVKAVRLLIQIRIGKLKTSMSTKTTFIFKNPDFYHS